MSNNKDRSEFEQDETVSQLYHSLEREEPSADTDAFILAAARREVNAKPQATKPSFIRRWQIPVASAASLMLAALFVLEISIEPPLPLQASKNPLNERVARIAKKDVMQNPAPIKLEDDIKVPQALNAARLAAPAPQVADNTTTSSSAHNFDEADAVLEAEAEVVTEAKRLRSAPAATATVFVTAEPAPVKLMPSNTENAAKRQSSQMRMAAKTEPRLVQAAEKASGEAQRKQRSLDDADHYNVSLPDTPAEAHWAAPVRDQAQQLSQQLRETPAARFSMLSNDLLPKKVRASGNSKAFKLCRNRQNTERVDNVDKGNATETALLIRHWWQAMVKRHGEDFRFENMSLKDWQTRNVNMLSRTPLNTAQVDAIVSGTQGKLNWFCKEGDLYACMEHGDKPPCSDDAVYLQLH